MNKKMRICKDCRTYSLKEICPKCGKKTSNAHPPSFSPEDKYGKYRREGIAKNLY